VDLSARGRGLASGERLLLCAAMNISKYARIVGTAAVALAIVVIAGCDSATPSAAPSASSAAPSSAATTPASSTTTEAAAAAPSPSGCPDALTLKTAFQANASISKAIVLGNGFVDIKCAGGFAIAQATPTNVDAARVLFKYDQASSGWTAITAGTGFACTDYMSADIASKLGC
jgi:hypothetical protein